MQFGRLRPPSFTFLHRLKELGEDTVPWGSAGLEHGAVKILAHTYNHEVRAATDPQGSQAVKRMVYVPVVLARASQEREKLY
jgi:hypothetical protein